MPTDALPPEALLEWINTVRRAAGLDELAKLEPGRPQRSRECLIAVNLNFDARVYLSGHLGTMAPKLVEACTKLDMASRRDYGATYFVLPDEVTASAKAYDRLEYPKELYRFEVLP